MGKQYNPREKRRRRKNYLKRLKERYKNQKATGKK